MQRVPCQIWRQRLFNLRLKRVLRQGRNRPQNHCRSAQRMSLLGHSRTCAAQREMSVKGHERMRQSEIKSFKGDPDPLLASLYSVARPLSFVTVHERKFVGNANGTRDLKTRPKRRHVAHDTVDHAAMIKHNFCRL